MRRILKSIVILAGILPLSYSCNQTEMENRPGHIAVNFIAGQIRDLDQTRSAYIDGQFQWCSTDTVGIYPNQGSQIFFSMADGAGTSSATFDGGGWGFRTNAVYYSYYPFIADFYLNRNHIPVSLKGQVQNGPSNLDHFGKYDYMYTPSAKADNGQLNFYYNHLVCIIRVTATLPAGSYRQITITAPTEAFVQEGYFDLQSESPHIIATSSSQELTIAFKNPITVNGNEQFLAYLISAPANLKGVELTVSAVDINEKQFDCIKTPSKNYEPSNLYGLGCTSWTEVPLTVTLAENAGSNGGYDPVGNGGDFTWGNDIEINPGGIGNDFSWGN